MVIDPDQFTALQLCEVLKHHLEAAANLLYLAQEADNTEDQTAEWIRQARVRLSEAEELTTALNRKLSLQ